MRDYLPVLQSCQCSPLDLFPVHTHSLKSTTCWSDRWCTRCNWWSETLC